MADDEKGDYLAISAFPGERTQWLAEMEMNLKALIEDDRAAIIARMIAIEDNDETVSLFKRDLEIQSDQNLIE